MSKTYSGNHKAIVKESQNGVPYICFELLDGKEIPNFINSNVGILFNDNTTYEQAENIANIINSELKGLYITKL